MSAVATVSLNTVSSVGDLPAADATTAASAFAAHGQGTAVWDALLSALGLSPDSALPASAAGSLDQASAQDEESPAPAPASAPVQQRALTLIARLSTGAATAKPASSSADKSSAQTVKDSTPSAPVSADPLAAALVAAQAAAPVAQPHAQGGFTPIPHDGTGAGSALAPLAPAASAPPAATAMPHIASSQTHAATAAQSSAAEPAQAALPTAVQQCDASSTVDPQPSESLPPAALSQSQVPAEPLARTEAYAPASSETQQTLSSYSSRATLAETEPASSSVSRVHKASGNRLRAPQTDIAVMESSIASVNAAEPSASRVLAVNHAPAGAQAQVPAPAALHPSAESAQPDAAFAMSTPAAESSSRNTHALTPHAATPSAFEAIDRSSAAAAPHATWTTATPTRAEAGYQDPDLGWINVRARLDAAGVHATVVPSTEAAVPVVSDHMAGLGNYLAEQHTPVETLTLASPDMSAGQQQSSGDPPRDGSPPVPLPATGAAPESAAQIQASAGSAARVLGAMGNARYISVLA